MSGQHGDIETLFSFELLVEWIRIDKEKTVSDELALGVRLLDFPTLLIYQPEKRSDEGDEADRGEHSFNRGKSCFFKMNLDSLHVHLSSNPLYVMVLDVREELPRLAGTSLISLAKVTDRIRQDVAQHGVSASSSHGEKGIVGVKSITGETVGLISLSYKLIMLGVSSLQQVTGRTRLRSSTHTRQQDEQRDEKDNKSIESPSNCAKVQPSAQSRSDFHYSENSIFVNEENKEESDCSPTKTEHKTKRQTPRETDNSFDDSLTVFCPPHLYYSNSGEGQSMSEDVDGRLSRQDYNAFTSQDESSDEKIQLPASSVRDQRAGHTTEMSSNQQASTANPIGDALRQLPLLNALLVELAHLNGQNSQQPLSIHPNLAWIYASTEPLDGHGSTQQKNPTQTFKTTRHRVSPNPKHLHPPRNCSTPDIRPQSDGAQRKQQEPSVIKSPTSRSKKKLVYGTTKTFNLRMKKISPLTVKRRECAALCESEIQTSKTKEKVKNKTSSKRKSPLNRHPDPGEDVMTMIQSITIDTGQRNTHASESISKIHEVGRESPWSCQTTALSEVRYIHVPSGEGEDVARNKDTAEYHSESNQSQPISDSHREKIESSRSCTPKSLLSAASRAGGEEEDYADDFNSLEPSEANSPDPASSPEPVRTTTPKSPARSDNVTSDSESFPKRSVLPTPIKARGSPQRSLRGTHLIRPRTRASMLSFSSDDGHRDALVSARSAQSPKGPADWSSGPGSVRSPRARFRSESSKSSCQARECSTETASSLEAGAEEEEDDELGSLDFRRGYQHISELVANKLPGYTM